MLDRSSLAADPISDILSLLKPHNVACGAIDAGDGCIAFPPGSFLKCHAVVAGEAWLAVDGVADPLCIRSGDCVLLPQGRSYKLASDLRLKSTDYRVVLEGRLLGHVAKWNGGGRATIVSATFTIDERYGSMLLDILPPVVRFRDDPTRPALSRAMLQMMQELREPAPGSRLIVEQLATMVLTLALRACVVHSAAGDVGWLFALADRRIGATIGAMHSYPARAWTVQALAESVGMSRTSFAVRFKSTVGSSPMAYLTRLRMLLASERLSTSEDAIGAVARSLGYDSESAFSSAFKRQLGCSPRRFAKQVAVETCPVAG